MNSRYSSRIRGIGHAAAVVLTSFISVGIAAAQDGGGLPNVIDSCYYQKPPSKDKFCQSWVRNGDKFEQIGGGNAGIVSAAHFSGGTATFNQANGSSGTQTYTGRIKGNHIDGTVTFGAKETGISLNWSATFFNAPPTAATNPARHIYVACADKVSVVDTATHAVNTVAINDGAKNISAIAVSPDSSTAYVTTNDPQWKAGLFVIDGNAGTLTRTVSLQGTPLAAGATSLAISGDGSTLFGVGITKAVAIVALDTSSGALKSTQPLPKGYSGGQMVMNPRIVVSGAALVLDDGSIAEAMRVTGDPVFGSDSHGMAAFPDGKRICGPNGILLIGSKARQTGKGCSAISADGARTFQDNMQLRSDFGTAESNPDFGAVVGMLGKAVALSSDGATVYTLIRSNLYSVDASSHLTTDAIRVCESPELLGAAPLHARAAPPNASTPIPASASPTVNPVANTGESDGDRVVAEIEGKPMTARQALDLLKNVPPQVRQQRANDLSGLVRQLYMQHAIAQEALKLHLDREQPWVNQITQAYGQTIGRFPPPRRDIPPEITLSYNNAREHILWNAYFSRAGNADQRIALLKQKREEYKLTVQDESFFKQR